MGLFFIICGLPFLATGWLMHLSARAHGKRAAQWPTTTGAVFSSEVGVVAAGLSQMLLPVVTYDYEVAGAKLRSRRLQVGIDRRYNTPSKVQAVVDAHPVGSAVSVRYNPVKPGEAALDPTAGEGFGPLYLYAFGGTFVGLGLVAKLLGA